MYEHCQFCMTVDVCINNSEVILTLKTLFNTSVLSVPTCDTNATSNHFITPNTPVELQNEGLGYYFNCPICDHGTHNIHYYVERSMLLDNASSCSTTGMSV